MDSGDDPGERKLSVTRLVGQDVKGFSSQYGTEERMSYAAQNLAGECNIYPNYGDFTQACVFRMYGPWWRMAPSAPKPYRKTPEPEHLGSEDFIEVQFERRLYPVAVHIYETYNPGAIVRILGCDYQAGSSVDSGSQSRWRTLWSGPVTETNRSARIFSPPNRSARIFSPPIRRINTPINMVRLELNHSLLHYYTELDSIMLCGVTTLPHPDDYPYLEAQAKKQQGSSSPVPVSPPPQVEKKGNWWGGLPKGEEKKVADGMQSLSIQDKSGDRKDNSHPQAFSTLPGEVIVMILGYLDFPSLGRVAQTCRLLQRHAYDCILYTELNLQPVWNMVSDSTLGGLSERCDSLQRLNLSWCGDGYDIRDAGFLRLLKSCSKRLTCLQLSCCSFLTHDTLRIITSTCPNIKELDVSGCEEMDKVSGVFIPGLPDLERLNLYRTKVDTQTIINIIRKLAKLKYLNLGSCKLVINSGEVVEALGSCCPDLRSLDMWRAINLPNNAFQKFIDGCPLLEELDVGWCPELNSRTGSFTRLAQNCKNLKKLFLTANRTVCDEDLLALAKHSRQLQQLDILGTRAVSSDAMQKVLSSCPDLVMVDVSFCALITDPDVEDWKIKYPHINIKKSFQN
ncbi:hypothetical protein ACOMHN_035980 [Nucella lapillus]